MQFFFIGLLPQYYGVKKNFPVVRRGSLALITDEAVPTPAGPEKGYLAEVTSWPGNSGSPVFLNLAGMRGGGLRLGFDFRYLGILIGSEENRIPAQTSAGQSLPLGNEFNTGITFILAADCVREVLDSPRAMRLRDDELRRIGKNP